MAKSILDFFYRIFGKKSEKEAPSKHPLSTEDIRLEPEYWQEVIDFIDQINALIKAHTIDDQNIHHINQRIVDYIKEQINIKGSIEDIEKRYTALDILADRILSNSLGKIVGLKHDESSRAEFTETVEAFKQRLRQRRQEELALHQKITPN